VAGLILNPTRGDPERAAANSQNQNYNSCQPRLRRTMVHGCQMCTEGLKKKPAVRACRAQKISRTKALRISSV
jgi:hypothetical protein